MEMRNLVVIFLLLDALIVLFVGVTTVHGEHGWDFFLVNGARLAVMGAIVALWRVGTSKRLEGILFRKSPAGE